MSVYAQAEDDCEAADANKSPHGTCPRIVRYLPFALNLKAIQARNGDYCNIAIRTPHAPCPTPTKTDYEFSRRVGDRPPQKPATTNKSQTHRILLVATKATQKPDTQNSASRGGALAVELGVWEAWGMGNGPVVETKCV